MPAFPLGGTNAAPRPGSPNLPGATAAMLGSMAFSQSLTNSPPADLIVWWIFGEGSGTNVEDASGNGNNGTLFGNPLPTWANGVTSGALTFDGSQNYVQSDQAFNQTISAFTIEAWFAATSVYGENPAILSTLGDDIGFNSLADIVIYTNSAPNGNSIGLDLHWGDLLTAPVGLIDGNWHHVAGVWDGTTSSLYVDGQLVATQSDVHAAFTWTTPLRLAYRDTNGGCHYGGQIGEVRIYSRALSGDEVATNYNADTIGDGIPDWWRLRYFGSGTTTNGVSCATCDPNGNRIPNSQEYQNDTNPLLPSGLTVSTNLIAWWMFNEGTGAFVGDVSGNGHCGVLLGNSPPTWTNGVTSGALTFDGQNYVQTELPFHETISAYTIEAWFSAVSAYGQNPAIISTLGDDIGFNSLADIVIYTNSVYNGHNSIGLDMHWGDLLLAYMGLFDGNWHQVTGTWDGSNSTLYVDGQRVATQADVHGIFSWTTPLRLAYRDTNGGCNFGGDIGEIRIYDQALSSNEVLASYNTSTVGDGIPNWWRLKYFNSGTTTNSQSCASCDADGSGLSNSNDYACGFNPVSFITTRTAVASGTTNNIASIPSSNSGVSYSWSVSNGTITGGTNATAAIWTAGNVGTATICVTLSNSSSCVGTICTNISIGPAYYYVDYAGGSDAHAGTNPATAWMHCPGDIAAVQVPALVTNILPGTTIFFKGGVQYVFTSSYTAPYTTGIGMNWGGSSDNPITYMSTNAWGGGTRAIFTDYYSTNFYAAFYIDGSISNLVFNNLEFGPMGGGATVPTPGAPSGQAYSTTPSNGAVFFPPNWDGINWDTNISISACVGQTNSGIFSSVPSANWYFQNDSTADVHCTNIVVLGGPFWAASTNFTVPANQNVNFITINFGPTSETGIYTNGIVFWFDNGQILTNEVVGYNGLAPNNAYGILALGSMTNVLVANCYFHNLGWWQNQPPITGPTLESGNPFSSAGVSFFGGAGLTVTNCEFTQVHTGVSDTWSIDSSNLVVSGCYFHDYVVWGLYLSGVNGNMDYITVNSNTFKDIGWAYAYDWSQMWPGAGTPHQDPIFFLASYTNATTGLHNNFYDNTWTVTHTNAVFTAGIYLEYAVSANIYNNLFDLPNTGDPGGGADLGGGAPPIVISWELDDPSSNVIRILNNTMIVNQTNVNQSTALHWGACDCLSSPYAWPTNAFLQVYNNLAYSWCTNGTAQGTLLVLGVVTNSPPVSMWAVDYNNWYDYGGRPYFWWNNNPGYNTNGALAVEQWAGFDLHGYTNNPGFVNLTYGSSTNSRWNNYALQTNSPCIGAGTNLSGLNLPGLNYNLNGQTNGRPKSGLWNLGAY